jgi:hypothetical protein
MGPTTYANDMGPPVARYGQWPVVVSTKQSRERFRHF